MSVRARNRSTTRGSVRRRVAAATVAVLGCAALAACDGGGAGRAEAEPTAEETRDKVAPVSVTTNLPRGSRPVPVDHRLQVRVEDGELRRVVVTAADGTRVPGRQRGDRWQATELLEEGTAYEVRTTALRSDGARRTRTTTFRTEDLTLDEQTFPSVAPLAGETVGVGMPVIVTFDIPVTDRETFERHMRVRSTPRQRGTWHWVDDSEVHWRPRTYWQPGTDVTVDLDLNSLPAGNGIYGQKDRTVDFHVGDAVVSRVDVDAHEMAVLVNGELARTIPISAGKEGWETRSGTKVIMEKFRRKRMNAATIGVDPDDPEYYDLSNVQYAMRVTSSGEFLHAAPWSVGSQGSANVSHGCVGMSLEDAAWLYGISKRGDVVEVTGSERWMTLYNGYGDWNAPFAEYAEGSALR